MGITRSVGILDNLPLEVPYQVFSFLFLRRPRINQFSMAVGGWQT